jgi:hypothetical protein
MASNAIVLSGDSSDLDLDYDSAPEGERRTVRKLVPVNKSAPPTGGIRNCSPDTETDSFSLPYNALHPCEHEDTLRYCSCSIYLTARTAKERKQCFNANIEHPDVADMRIIERVCVGFVFLSHDNKPKVDHYIDATPAKKYLKSLEQRVYILETTFVRKNSDSIGRYYVAVPHTLYPTCCGSTDVAISNNLLREGAVAGAFQKPPSFLPYPEFMSSAGHRVCADVHSVITGNLTVSGILVPLSLVRTQDFLQLRAKKFQNELIDSVMNANREQAKHLSSVQTAHDKAKDRIKELETERSNLQVSVGNYAHQEAQLRGSLGQAKRKCDELQGQLHDEKKRTQACEDMYGQLANELEPALKRLHAKYSDDEDVKAFQAAASQVLHACSPCAICHDITKTQDLVHFDCQCSTAVCEECIVQLAGNSQFKCLTCPVTSLHPKTKDTIQDACITLTTG